MGTGVGINEERLKVRALVGECMVVSGGELGLCPVLSWPYSIPKTPVTAGTSEPPSWKRVQRVYPKASGLMPVLEQLSGGYASKPQSMGLKDCNYPQLDRLSWS